MVSPDLQQGFKVLRDREQLDKTFEVVVVRFQHLFGHDGHRSGKMAVGAPV
jgi:hypothetical protein